MNISNETFCDFITEDSLNFECVNCGFKIRATTPQENMPIFLCQKPTSRRNQDDVSFAKKLQNFAKSTINHIKNGMPMCSEEEIIARHNICLECEYFKDDTCSKCGCPLLRHRQFVSKLAWADQECPIGKWGKINKN